MIKLIFLKQRLFFAVDEEKGRKKKAAAVPQLTGSPK